MRWRAIGRIAQQLLVVVFVTASVCLTAALLTSKLYWGYAWSRPSVDVVLDAADVAEITAVAYVQGERGDARLAARDVDVREAAERCDEYPVGCLADRGLLHVADRLPVAAPHPSAHALAELLALYESRPTPSQRNGTYDAYRSVWGLVIEYNDHSGAARTFFAAGGSSVSNDHRLYQELDLRRTTDGYVIERRQHFFYDVAGIEGADWAAFWLFYSILGFGLVVLTACLRELWRLARHRIGRRRAVAS